MSSQILGILTLGPRPSQTHPASPRSASEDEVSLYSEPSSPPGSLTFGLPASSKKGTHPSSPFCIFTSFSPAGCFPPSKSSSIQNPTLLSPLISLHPVSNYSLLKVAHTDSGPPAPLLLTPLFTVNLVTGSFFLTISVFLNP